MNVSKKADSNLRNIHRKEKAHVSEAASALLGESKKRVNELYGEGLDKINELEDQARIYSDQLAYKVKENPISAVLIAAGVGFLLSKILK